MASIDPSMYISTRRSVRLKAMEIEHSECSTTQSQQSDQTVNSASVTRPSLATTLKRRHDTDQDEIVVAPTKRSKANDKENYRVSPTSQTRAVRKRRETKSKVLTAERPQRQGPGITEARKTTILSSQSARNSRSDPGSRQTTRTLRSTADSKDSQRSVVRRRCPGHAPHDGFTKNSGTLGVNASWTTGLARARSEPHGAADTSRQRFGFVGPRAPRRSSSVGAVPTQTDLQTEGSVDRLSGYRAESFNPDMIYKSLHGNEVTPQRQQYRSRTSSETPKRSFLIQASYPYGLLTPPPSQRAIRVESSSDELLTLSKKLTRREPLASKPKPRGQPLVWADSRQALCETVPYFKMPQSGCHQNDGHVYAFLLDSAAGCREYMDSDVVIARAGGGMEVDDNGRMIPRRNHKMKDAQVKAVLNDIAHQNPLVIICGNRNESTQCQMPHKYSVLGWYKPIAVWGEKMVGKRGTSWTIIKYRFERLNNNHPAWHSPEEDNITDQEREIAGCMISATCLHCQQEFGQVYLLAWMCLNPECCHFWKVHDTGQDADYEELDYHPAFLLDRTKWPKEIEPYSVRPKIPDVGNTIGDNLTRINTRGICCPQCGRCSPRRLFRGWKCDTPNCSFEFMPHHTSVKPSMLHNPWDTTGEGPSLAQNKFGPGVKVVVEHTEGYKIFRYTITGIEGCLLHAVSNDAINERSRGPNELFEAMQRQDSTDNNLHLERRRFAIQRMADSKPEDGDLMMAFSMNYGMPYKFVASGASLSFEDSPWPVRVCRSTLNQASQAFLHPSEHRDFNELLIFAYMEGQKIEYHDDGEKGLGPRIATLSLGGKAKMHLRMKRKHYVGCSLQGVFTSDQPRPGGIDGAEMDRKRLAAWQELQPVRDQDRAMYERRRKEIPYELGLFEKRNKWAPDLVTLTLHHGDIVLMEGYEIQQYLEHKVVPDGCLRFALTCRTVLEDHLLPDEKPGYEVAPDDGQASFL